tara:strand:- start:16 stop:255 length:240 start_codon:yes stop_codon:yes gene_type:complete
MAEKQKTAITVNNKDYFLEDMTEKQRIIVNHCADLSRKMDTMLFNVDQLGVGKKTFDDMLIKELEDPQEDKVEEAEVVN